MAQSPGSSASGRAALYSSVTQEPNPRQATVKGLCPDVIGGDLTVPESSHFATCFSFVLEDPPKVSNTYV